MMLTNVNNETQATTSGLSINLLNNVIMCAFLFAFPLNSSAKSITLAIAVGWLLFTRVNGEVIRSLLARPWVMAILAFLVLVMVECPRSPAPWNEISFVVQKYSKLLWLPVLALGFSDKKTRFLGLHAFLTAMFITCIVAFFQAAQASSHEELLQYGTVFRNYIITGHMMCLAAYLSAYFAIKSSKYRNHRLIYIGLFLLFSYEVLFFSLGRTGYVIYFVLMTLLMIQMLSIKQLFFGLLASILLIVTVYHYSPRMQTGFEMFQQNLQTFKEGNRDTSIGFRLQFQKFAFQLFRERPLVGHGTGSFTHLYDVRNPIPGWGKQLREPHNQYWLVAAEYGLFGSIMYALLLGTLFMACLRLTEMKNIAMAVFFPFVIGSFSDSLLFFSGSGYFFLAFMALCLGESMRGLKSEP